MQYKYTMQPTEKQAFSVENRGERLVDRSSTGREYPWAAKKSSNELLSLAYLDVDRKKAGRLRECAQLLRFRADQDGKKQLDMLNSCRVRLCPMCSWRRSLKAYYNAISACGWLQEHGYTRYIFVTLTCRNCSGEHLSGTITRMLHAFDRLSKRAIIRRSWAGWIRSMEITHNVDYVSKSFDTYHPHFHLLVAVSGSYYGRDYISQRDLAQLWREALGADYDPVVDVRRVKRRDRRADQSGVADIVGGGDLAEVSKYAVKDADYIIPDDWDLSVDAVRVLDRALANRRLIAYSGCFADAKRALALEDEDSGDLINVGDDQQLQVAIAHIYYGWFAGVREDGGGDYFKIFEEDI